MSLISESLKRAHDDRSQTNSRPAFNLVAPQSETPSRNSNIIRIAGWLVIPVLVLTGLIMFGLNRQGTVEIAQVSPELKTGGKITPLDYTPASEGTEKKSTKKEDSPPQATRLPRVQKTSTVTSDPPEPKPVVPKVAKPNIQALTVYEDEDEKTSAFDVPENFIKKNKVPVKKPAVKMEKTLDSKPEVATKAPEKTNKRLQQKREMSKVQVTLTPKKPPAKKAVVASLPPKAVAPPKPHVQTSKQLKKEDIPDEASKTDLTRDSEFYFKMGVFYQRTGDLIEALDYYNKALQLDPVNAEIYNNQSLIYKELGKYDRAVTGFLKAIHFDPKYVKAYNNIGLLYFLKNNHSAAISSFQKAIELNPRNLESYNNLAAVYKKQDNLVQARQLYQAVLKKNPSQIEAHYNLALLYEQEGDYPNAIAHYKRFVELGVSLRPKLVSKVKTHLKLLQ